MKENYTSLWKRESVLLRSNLTRGGARWIPRTLSSMQIVLICGFAAIVLLRNTLSPGGFGLPFQFGSEAETIPNSSVSSNSAKRNIARIEEDVQKRARGVQDQPDHHLQASDERVEEDQVVETVQNSKEKGVQETISVDPKEEEVEEISREEFAIGEKFNDSSDDKILKPNAELEQNEKLLSGQQQRKLETEFSVEERSDSFQQQGMTDAEVKAEDMWMSTWMPSGFTRKSLGPNPKNWDAQRAQWLQKYPHMRLNSDGKPRMLLVTGSNPWACTNPLGDHYLLKSIKNKIDYCRQHNIEIFYNLAHLDKEMSTFWAKLPILRKLMLTHPEIEWFFWMDADAIFTDMLFQIPMDDYKDYNLVMWGFDGEFYNDKNWLAINDGVFFLRNCQWTLDLFDMWAPMGPEGAVRNEAGKMIASVLSKRSPTPADDQAALAYLLITRKELRPKVKLVWEYELSGYFAIHVTHYEEYMTKDHPGLGDKRWPFTTHFVGCQICTGIPNPAYEELGCAKQMERAFNFADNQILQTFGFMHETLESAHLKRIKEDDDHLLDNVGPNTWATASQSYGL